MFVETPLAHHPHPNILKDNWCWWSGAASSVLRSVFRTIVVKKELSQKVKFSNSRSTDAPSPTDGEEHWDKATDKRSRMQAAGRGSSTAWRGAPSEPGAEPPGLGRPRNTPGRAGGPPLGEGSLSIPA